MEKEKLTPHYIGKKLQSQYTLPRDTMGVDEAIEATKEWAIREYDYVMRVNKPSNEWLEELDKAIKDIANQD